ncbi:Type IV pilin N-term methylation site GFxxxE [Candidatus Electrothrix communis]|uniref:Type IV pilin N-term methylation site GFxxxE n=1 Tax=Candidatus Electrothrix communis TaxID=1859133 RepID=A0A444J9K1_9BACT|nr:Type IV pilin N-term methylation site GFxxxE [Candidatus Electrothrix communis]WLE97785.1 MAG: PilW family protein [Candidatus Electrothrix communis]
MQRREQKENGFTLIEVMVSMVIASFVFAGIYGVYTIQQRSYTVQEQVSEMQQKGRAALDFLVRDIRMARYNDPDGACTSGDMAVWSAGPASFTFDTCDQSNTQQTVTYSLIVDNTKEPPAYRLVRTVGTGTAQTIAEDIEAVEFFYTIENNTEPVTFTSMLTVPAANMAQIRSVQISLLIRSTYPDRKHRDGVPYYPASELPDPPPAVFPPPVWDINGTTVNGTGNPPTTDPCDDELDRCHYHRRLLITTVKMRNMGL